MYILLEDFPTQHALNYFFCQLCRIPKTTNPIPVIPALSIATCHCVQNVPVTDAKTTQVVLILN